MEKSFVDWIIDNSSTIKTLWDGLNLFASLTLNTILPSEPIDYTKYLTQSAIISEEMEVEYLYDFSSAALDAIDLLDQSGESDFEGVLPNANEVALGEPLPDFGMTISEGLQDLDVELLPGIDEGINYAENQLDEIELPQNLIEEASNTVSEVNINEESEENEAALDCFQDYYLSHGRPQELSDEYSMYWSD